jgi:hypothetical protein
MLSDLPDAVIFLLIGFLPFSDLFACCERLSTRFKKIIKQLYSFHYAIVSHSSSVFLDRNDPIRYIHVPFKFPIKHVLPLDGVVHDLLLKYNKVSTKYCIYKQINSSYANIFYNKQKIMYRGNAKSSIIGASIMFKKGQCICLAYNNILFEIADLDYLRIYDNSKALLHPNSIIVDDTATALLHLLKVSHVTQNNVTEVKELMTQFAGKSIFELCLKSTGIPMPDKFVLCKCHLFHTLNLRFTFATNDYQEKLEITQMQHALDYIRYASRKTVRFNTRAFNHV